MWARTKQALRETRTRIVKDFLDVLIMMQLKEEPKSAYDVITFTHEKFQILLSPGTVYSTFYSLERSGLVQGSHSGINRARVYILTEKGEKAVQIFQNLKDKIQLFVANLF